MTRQRLKTISIILFCAITLVAAILWWLSISDSRRNQVIGSWNVDFENTYIHSNSDSESIEFINGWTIFQDDNHIDLPPLYIPNNSVQNMLEKSRGTWSIGITNDSINIDAPNHPFNGKYLMNRQKVKRRERSITLLRLSNDSTDIVLYR